MLDYTSVRKQYDLLYGAGVTKKSMPEWASEMNQLTGSNIYDQGTRDGWWTRTSHMLDEKVFKPYSYSVLPVAPIAAGIGSLLGNEEVGRHFGESLPRTLLETAPLYLGPVGAPIVGGLMAAHTYADTGSAKAAAIAGVTGTALPFAGKLGGSLAARAFGTAEQVATETATGTLPFQGGWFAKEGSELGFKAASFGGSQTAQVALNEASMYATAKATGTEFDPLSPEFLAQQIPFTVFDAVHTLPGKPLTSKAAEGMRVAPETPRPERVVPASTPEQEAQREALFLRLQEVTNNAEASPEERTAALEAAIKGTTDTPTVIALKKFAKTGEMEPVTVTGWGKRLESTGAYKIVVDPERSDASIRTEDHGNLFVNDKNVTMNPDGSFTFKTDPRNLRTNVDFPLKAEEVRPDPNQPNLPVQKNGLHPDETRIFEKVGVKPPEVPDAVFDPAQNPQGTVAAIAEIQRRNAPLRPIAQELEQTERTLQSAKESIAKVPESAEDWEALTSHRLKEGILKVDETPLILNHHSTDPAFHLGQFDVTKTDYGADFGPGVYLDPGHGWEEAVSERPSGEVKKTFTQQTAIRRGVKVFDQVEAHREEFASQVDAADVVIDRLEDGSISQVFVKNPDDLIPITNPKTIVEQAIREGHTPTQAVEAARLSTHTPIVDASLEQQNVLKATAEKVISTDLRGKPQAQYGEAVRDENGQNFKTRALAEAHRDADPDLAEHVVRNAGSGKGYYLAPQINKEVSLEGTNLEAVLSDPTPVDSRPDVSIMDVMGVLERAGAHLDVFDEIMGNDDIGKTLKEVQFTKKFLFKTMGGEKVELDDAMRKVVLKVTKASGEWNNRFRSWDLESAVPHDEALVQKMGIREGGLRAGLDWFSRHEKAGPMGQLVGDMLRFAENSGFNLSDIDFRHNPHEGWAYFRGSGETKPFITYNRLPSSENDAFRWALSGAHELAHHLGDGLLSRADPQAVKFRATLKTVLYQLDKSEHLPKGVRQAVLKSRAEGWYDQYAEGKIDYVEMRKRFEKIAGEENKKFFPTFYGMQDEHELFATMFQDRDLVVLLGKTKMEKKGVQTVLQWFSQAWNRLMNGSADRDNALHQILTGFEDYLSGPKFARRPAQKPLMLIRGNKGRALQIPEVASTIQDLAQQSSKVIDAFSGSGKIAEAAKDLGAGSVVLNVRDPNFFDIFHDIKQDPESFANRVEQVVSKIDAQRVGKPTLVDGGDLEAYLNEVEKNDPTVGMFVKQQFSPRGDEVQKGVTKVSLGLTNQGLSELPQRIRDFAGKIDTLTSEDGWSSLDKSQKSEGVVLDPPYVNSRNVYGGETRTLTPEQRIKDYQNHVLPAKERGVKLTIFDVADPKLIQFLQDNGFDVTTFTRPPTGKSVPQPELLATSGVARKPAEVYQARSLYNGRDYLRDALIAKGVRPEGLASRIDSVERLFSTGDLAVSVEGFQREQGAGTLPATTNSGEVSADFSTALLQNGPTEVYRAAKDLLAGEVPLHQDLWARLRQDVSTAMELLRNIKKGFVPGSVPEGVEGKLTQAFTKINATKNGLDKNAAAIERWSDLQNFTTDGFENTLASQLVRQRRPAPPDPTPNQDVAQGLLGLANEVAEVRRETALAELQGKPMAPGLLTRWVGLTQHVKKLYPSIRPLMDNVRMQFARQFEDNRVLKLIYDGYNPTTKEFDKAVRQRNIRIATTPALEKAASNMRRWGNIWEQAGEEWDSSRPEIQDILSKFNVKDRQALLDEANSGRARYHTWVNIVVPEKLSQLNTASTAKVIAAHEVGMLPENARDLSAKIYDALAAMHDPTQAVGGQEMLRQISAKMQPDTFLSALRYSQDMVTAANKDLELMRSRPSYAPEQRYDNDHLVMQGPKGQAFRAGGDRKTLLKRQQDLEVQGYKFLDYIPKSTTDTPVGIRSDFLDAMRESDLLRQQRLEQALEKAPPDVAATVLADAQRTSQYEALSNAFKPLPRVTRNFVEGREYINMLHNEDEFYSRSLNWYRHQITRAETSLDMMHPEVAGNRILKEYGQQHVDNALSPDNPFFRKLIKTVYFQRLAFSLGNSLLESVQNLGTGMQAVIAETGSVTDTFKLWGSAIKNITSKSSRSVDMQWMFKRAQDLGLRRITTFRDIHDPDSEGAHFILSKNPLVKGATALQAGATKWATMFQRFNDDIGLSAGFQLGLEKGMSREDAFNFAWDLKERGLYTGGKAQRPVAMWNIKTKAVPQMLNALQTYTLGWFSQMSTDFKIGYRGQGEGLTELQRTGSRKAFVYGLAAQATLAGALGLPGVGQGLALIKQATGLDLKGQLRSSLASLFDEDTESGGMLTNLALRGGLAGFSPIDPSNRAAISFPFVGVDPYKGFDMAQLLGAPGASIGDAVKGTLAMMKGDAQGFQKLLPSVLRPPLQLIQGEGDVRDARGGLLQTLTPAERWLTAIGLPSSRIQAARDTSEAVKNLNTAATAEKERLVDDLATTYRRLGPTQGQQKVAAYLQDHPQEDGAELVRSVATRVRRQTLPYDYRRDLAKGVDLHGLGSRLPSSETEGRKLEYDVQKNLGLLPRFNLRADVNAVSIDQLLDSNPYLSRSEALRQVSEKSRVRRPSRILNFQQPQSLFQ